MCSDHTVMLPKPRRGTFIATNPVTWREGIVLGHVYTVEDVKVFATKYEAELAKVRAELTELKHRYGKAMTRIAELAAAQRWQPMETAPREAVEGEERPPRLLLYLDNCVCVGRWEPSISLWIVDGYTYRECAFKGWQYPPKGPEEHGC